MKVYARQVAPEYQEAPLSLGDEFYPDGIILDGNKDYLSRKTNAYEKVLTYIDDAFEDIEKIQVKEGWYKTVTECIMDYFKPEHKEKYTTNEIAEWKKIITDYHSSSHKEEYRQICLALLLITGKKYAHKTICGCCQRDWQEVYYPVDDVDIDCFATEYFNTGTEWIVHDENEVPESPEDISGSSIYCYSWNDDGIRKEISDYNGCAPEDVVLYRHAGYTQVSHYEQIA